MNYLLDTHLLLWAAGMPEKLSKQAVRLIDNPDNQLYFSAASIWEIAIKNSLGRDDFKVDPRIIRHGLLDNGYIEIPISGQHAAAVSGLPDIHKDPFDRILITQSQIEGITLLTNDAVVAQYPGPVQLLI